MGLSPCLFLVFLFNLGFAFWFWLLSRQSLCARQAGRCRRGAAGRSPSHALPPPRPSHSFGLGTDREGDSKVRPRGAGLARAFPLAPFPKPFALLFAPRPASRGSARGCSCGTNARPSRWSNAAQTPVKRRPNARPRRRSTARSRRTTSGGWRRPFGPSTGSRAASSRSWGAARRRRTLSTKCSGRWGGSGRWWGEGWPGGGEGPVVCQVWEVQWQVRGGGPVAQRGGAGETSPLNPAHNNLPPKNTPGPHLHQIQPLDPAGRAG